eukprot:930671-Pyramimonas_sp.AAC.1
MWCEGLPSETQSLSSDLKHAVVAKVTWFCDMDWTQGPLPAKEELSQVGALAAEANVAFPMDAEVTELQQRLAVVLQFVDSVDRR